MPRVCLPAFTVCVELPASNSRHCSSTHVDAVATGVVLTKYDMPRRVLAVYQSDSPNYSGYQDYVKSVAIVSQISKYVKVIRGHIQAHHGEENPSSVPTYTNTSRSSRTPIYITAHTWS